jgi:acetylxylan esterase
MAPSTLSALFLLLLPASVLAAPAATCNQVQIFIAVGHGETFPGTQLGIAKSVCQGRASCGYQEIVYRARDSGNYCVIAEEGIKSAVDALTKYATDCPDSKLVITGWSQGGWLVGDVIGGGGGPGKGAAEGCTQKDSTGLDPTTLPGNRGKATFSVLSSLSLYLAG